MKKISRIISFALVLAMVCAMVPAVFAVQPFEWTGIPETGAQYGDVLTITATCPSHSGSTVTIESEDLEHISGNRYRVAKVGTITVKANCDEGDFELKQFTANKVALTPAGRIEGGKTVITSDTFVKGTSVNQIKLALEKVFDGLKNGTTSTDVQLYVNEWTAPVEFDSSVEGTYYFEGNLQLLNAVNDPYYAAPDSAVYAKVIISNVTVALNGSSTAVYKQYASPSELKAIASSGYGAGSYTYQWYSSASSSFASEQAVTGANTALFAPAVLAVGTTYYRCKVTSTKVGFDDLIGYSETIKITVDPVKYIVELAPTVIKSGSYQLSVGDEKELTAKIYSVDNAGAKTAYTAKPTVTFTSSDSTVLSLSKSSAAADASGKATVDVKAKKKGDAKITASVSISGSDYKGSAVLNVKETVYSADTIYVDEDYFDGDDFYDEVKEASGEKLNYVIFNTQTNGTLYKGDDSKVTMGTTKVYYSKSGSSYVEFEDLYFEIKDDSKTASLTYTAYNSEAAKIATGKVIVGEIEDEFDIEYEVDAKESVSFDADDFEDFFLDEYSGGELSYVKFNVSDAKNYGSSSYGYLYNEDDDKVAASEKYYFDATSSQLSLDELYFKAGTKTTKFFVEIPFTAYGENKSGTSKNVSGVLGIAVNYEDDTDNFTVNVSYKGETFGEMKLDDKLNVKNASYVQFSKPNGGTLYLSYTSASKNEKWAVGDKIYFSGKNNDLVEDLFFLPSSTVSTASVKYVVYSSSKAVLMEGTIIFKVDGPITFNDIENVKSWAGTAIAYMADKGYIAGTGSNKFSPLSNMTRGQFVTILYRLEDEPSVTSLANPFNDVASGKYYFNAVKWAYKNDVVSGVSATKFNPEGYITRQDIAKILFKYAQKFTSFSMTATDNLVKFGDYKNVSSYAYDAVVWANYQGILTGNNGKILPKNYANRAEVAVMLYRFLTK